MPQHGGRGQSVKKMERERAKRQKRMQGEKERDVKTPEELLRRKLKKLGKKQKEPAMALRQFGMRGWFPHITVKAFSKLGKGKHATHGNYTYMVTEIKPGAITFNAVQDMRGLRNRPYFAGTFMLDVKNKEIRKIRGGD